jgi:hypothetical protein
VANVLNYGEQVQLGALNWVFVSCVHHDIHLGKYSRFILAGYASFKLMTGNFCRYYGAMAPSFLAITAGVIFSILNSILGGQALSSVANISWTCVVLHATKS